MAINNLVNTGLRGVVAQWSPTYGDPTNFGMTVSGDAVVEQAFGYDHIELTGTDPNKTGYGYLDVNNTAIPRDFVIEMGAFVGGGSGGDGFGIYVGANTLPSHTTAMTSTDCYWCRVSDGFDLVEIGFGANSLGQVAYTLSDDSNHHTYQFRKIGRILYVSRDYDHILGVTENNPTPRFGPGTKVGVIGSTGGSTNSHECTGLKLTAYSDIYL